MSQAPAGPDHTSPKKDLGISRSIAGYAFGVFVAAGIGAGFLFTLNSFVAQTKQWNALREDTAKLLAEAGHNIKPSDDILRKNLKVDELVSAPAAAAMIEWKLENVSSKQITQAATNMMEKHGAFDRGNFSSPQRTVSTSDRNARILFAALEGAKNNNSGFHNSPIVLRALARDLAARPEAYSIYRESPTLKLDLKEFTMKYSQPSLPGVDSPGM